MEKIKEFYLKLAKSDEFKSKLAQFRQENGDDYENIIENVVLPQAKKMGYNFTKEDLLSYEEKNGSGSLSDEELLNVAGGFGKNQVVALSLGAIMGLSALGAAAGNFFGGSNGSGEQIRSAAAAAPETSISQMADQEDLSEQPEGKIETENTENSVVPGGSGFAGSSSAVEIKDNIGGSEKITDTNIKEGQNIKTEKIEEKADEKTEGEINQKSDSDEKLAKLIEEQLAQIKKATDGTPKDDVLNTGLRAANDPKEAFKTMTEKAEKNNEQNEDEAVVETPAAAAEVQYDNNNPSYRSPEQEETVQQPQYAVVEETVQQPQHAVVEGTVQQPQHAVVEGIVPQVQYAVVEETGPKHAVILSQADTTEQNKDKTAEQKEETGGKIVTSSTEAEKLGDEDQAPGYPAPIAPDLTGESKDEEEIKEDDKEKDNTIVATADSSEEEMQAPTTPPPSAPTSSTPQISVSPEAVENTKMANAAIVNSGRSAALEDVDENEDEDEDLYTEDSSIQNEHEGKATENSSTQNEDEGKATKDSSTQAEKPSQNLLDQIKNFNPAALRKTSKETSTESSSKDSSDITQALQLKISTQSEAEAIEQKRAELLKFLDDYTEIKNDNNINAIKNAKSIEELNALDHTLSAQVFVD